MFFTEIAAEKGARGGKGAKKAELLVIFGPSRGRIGSKLKILSAIEAKLPGFCTKSIENSKSNDDEGVDAIKVTDDELSFAVGSGGSTRRKLAAASGAMLEFVGNMAMIAGMALERARCTEYLRWLLQQLGILTMRRRDETKASAVRH